MTIADLIDYLMARQQTRDLAEELASAYALQRATGLRVSRVRNGWGPAIRGWSPRRGAR